MSRLHQRRRGERGAVLVELSFVLPLLIVLGMGIVDFATIFSQRITLRTGTREAAWNSSRGIFGSTQPCTTSFSSGTPNEATRRLVCMAKRRAEADDGSVRVKVLLVGLEGRPPSFTEGNGVLVCSMRAAQSVTGFFDTLLSDTVLTSRLTAVIIKIDPTNPIQEVSEAPLPGASWSFCDPSIPSG